MVIRFEFLLSAGPYLNETNLKLEFNNQIIFLLTCFSINKKPKYTKKLISFSSSYSKLDITSTTQKLASKKATVPS